MGNRKIKGLYLITDRKIAGVSIRDIAEEALKGGLSCLQLRGKDITLRGIYNEAVFLRKLTNDYSAALIINDHADVALVTEADGVHLGQQDLPIKEARDVLGREKIIGISTHSLEQAIEAQKNGADYIGFGPIFHTETKDAGSARGLDALREVRRHIYIPIVAIGGIKLDDVEDVLCAGADAIAVVSGILASGNIRGMTQAFLERINKSYN